MYLFDLYRLIFDNENMKSLIAIQQIIRNEKLFLRPIFMYIKTISDDPAIDNVHPININIREGSILFILIVN